MIDLIIIFIVGLIIYSQYPLTFNEIIEYSKQGIKAVGGVISPSHPLLTGFIFFIILFIIYLRYRELIWMKFIKFIKYEKKVKRRPL